MLLYRKGKGKEAHLSYLMHDVVDVDSGVILTRSVTQAKNSLEREATLRKQNEEVSQYRGLRLEGALINRDKNYCTKDFFVELQELRYVPNISVREDLKERPVPGYKRKAASEAIAPKRERKRKQCLAVNRLLEHSRSLFSMPGKKRHRVMERIFDEAKAMGHGQNPVPGQGEGRTAGV